jgi:ribonuclease III
MMKLFLKKSPFSEFEKQYGYKFKDKDLLKRSLTHRSYANEKGLPAKAHNERLEFLGDAVLELAVSEFLMSRFPHFSEGNLSKLRAAVVNAKQLAELAREYRIGDCLLLGHGEEQTMGREKPSLLADAYEAVLGAIYIDRGYRHAKKLVRLHYGRLFDNNSPESFYHDYKTELQEHVQSTFKSIPHYKIAGEEGPDHRKIFEVDILIKGDCYGKGVGHSKKAAEQKAAKQALSKLTSMKDHKGSQKSQS